LILPGKLVFNHPYYKWMNYMNTKAAYKIKVADEVWLAMALLHREDPSRTDFTLNEIVERAAKEGIMDELRPGVYVHAALHCVANRPPNPGRYRMLYETRPKYRRLFRLGDSYDPQREGSKVTPAADEIPPRYADLLEWYESWCRSHGEKASESDPLLALYGSGKKLWADEHADEYVARLRAGWE
jgi:hypothetical protein